MIGVHVHSLASRARKGQLKGVDALEGDDGLT